MKEQKSFKMNRKGQFSIIAALFVAAILISSVMMTYSTIRYSSGQDQPQIISAVDETNLALKQVLSFTVGYYGSVLQVTGNSSYAYTQSQNYLDSGLNNVANIQPQWGTSFRATALSLGTNWFTNASYSEGNLNVTYDLTGLGVSGITYSVSCRLDVQITPSILTNQAYITVIQDGAQPLVSLGMSNFKFYLYRYSNLTWAMINPPDEPLSASNGTYIVDIPSGINPQSYIIQVQDSRGIMVSASSFSHYTGSLTFNTTTVSGGEYVNQYNSSVDSVSDLGSHSNFTAQQQGPDGIYDTLREAANGTFPLPSYPTYWTPLGATSCVSGDTSKLAADDGVFMTLGSYGTSPSGQTLYAHQETSPLGSSYYSLKLVSADQSGTILSASAKKTGRILIGQFDYPLTGISSIPASSGTIYYRASKDSGPAGYFDADIVIRQSNGNLRTTLASPTGASNTVGTSWSTLSGTYSTSAYTVISQTDYLEIDFYAEVTTKSSNTNMYLQVDNSSLGLTSQTSITNINLPTSNTVQAQFTGSSSASVLSDLVWTTDTSASISGLTVNFQLYNWVSGQYANSGDGFMSATIGTSESLIPQTITSNPTSFLNSSGYWKVMVTATTSTVTPFNLNLDMIKYSPNVSTYALCVEEQWLNLNYTTLLHPTLCIDTGTMGANHLALDVWHSGAWQPLSTALVNGWNNISINSYIDTSSTNFTIRLRSTTETTQSSWQIDAALIRPESDQDLFLSLQNPAATVAVELLQNGTMIWLGQNLQLTSQAVPIPPVSVKAIHINETIDGVNQQMPFQVEDWASSYTIPLGLTNNATVFGNRQMIVFLVNTHVTDFTVWWNGSDEAVQTPLAYTNNYFHDTSGALNNGQLILSISNDNLFTVTATVAGKNTKSEANFMRVNTNASTYGAGSAFVIVNGTIRDIIQQEAEWTNGAGSDVLPNGTVVPPTCPNFYANIVLSLPADASYYTYQLGFMFINSQQSRDITDLSPIQLSCTVGSLQTENGTLQGDPVVANGTQSFNSTGTWVHHWSQFTDGTKGAGIMFTDQANQMLYIFDNMTSANATGVLSANSALQTISLLPVALNPVSFQNALDVAWYGAVVTFDGSAPPIYSGNGQPGMWILAELPPTITVTVGD